MSVRFVDFLSILLVCACGGGGYGGGAMCTWGLWLMGTEGLIGPIFYTDKT